MIVVKLLLVICLARGMCAGIDIIMVKQPPMDYGAADRSFTPHLLSKTTHTHTLKALMRIHSFPLCAKLFCNVTILLSGKC